MPAGSTEYDRWHRALAYALLGVDRPELGTQRSPKVDELVNSIDRAAVVAARTARWQADRGWPFPLPDDLAAGISWARFAALLAQVRQRLALDHYEVATRPSTGRASDRRFDREQQQLLDDRPPHWG